MKQFQCVVETPNGIHARIAALIAQLCVSLKSSVTITCNSKSANANDVLQILSLNAKKGDVLEVTIEGEDEEEYYEKLKKLVCTDCFEKSESGILKVAFYGTKDYDRLFFSKLADEKGPGTYNVDITYTVAGPSHILDEPPSDGFLLYSPLAFSTLLPSSQQLRRPQFQGWFSNPPYQNRCLYNISATYNMTTPTCNY